MEKINFINNSQPAINDTNLNKLQQNVEEAIQEVQDVADDLDTNKLDKTSVKDTYTESATDTYCCNYVNNFEDAVKPVDVTSRINFVNCTLNSGKVIKMGKIVYILVSITPTITGGWLELVSNLPSDLLPINVTDDGCPISNSNFWVYGGSKKDIKGPVNSLDTMLIKGFWILSD